jgi:hypothetical protein
MPWRARYLCFLVTESFLTRNAEMVENNGSADFMRRQPWIRFCIIYSCVFTGGSAANDVLVEATGSGLSTFARYILPFPIALVISRLL